MPQGRSAAPTIRDVAEAAGVSTATISRAFSRPGLLKQETVSRVHAVAARLRYRANPLARALSTGRQGNTAIVVPDVANPFFPPLLRAAQATADRAGYSVFLGDSDEDVVREQRLGEKLMMQVEGFILASSRMRDKEILEIGRRLPVVLINHDTPGISRVLIDTVPGIDAAVSHLVGLNHRGLVYVSGPAASWSDQQRRRAVARAARRTGVRIHLVHARRPTFDAGKSSADTILRTGATAAITFDDFVAHGLLAGLQGRGLQVPRDFSVIGCDDVLGAVTYPALTSVSVRCDEAGHVAADLLLKLLQTGLRTADTRCVLETKLVIRDTTSEAARRSLKERPAK